MHAGVFWLFTWRSRRPGSLTVACLVLPEVSAAQKGNGRPPALHPVTAKAVGTRVEPNVPSILLGTQSPVWNGRDADGAAIYEPPHSPLGVDFVLSNGGVRLKRVDLRLLGRAGLDLEIRRVYLSRADEDGSFGHGWFFNYEERLRVETNGDLLRRSESGHVDRWVKSGSDYVAPVGWFATLLKNPDSYLANSHMGTIHSERGDLRAALAYYREAHRVKPHDPFALNNLAWLLATADDGSVRNGEAAVPLAEEAAEITGFAVAEVLDTLAASYAAAGEYGRAVSAAQQAMEILSTSRDALNGAYIQIDAIVRVFIAAGAHEVAITELDAYLGGQGGYWSIEGLLPDPRLDPIRDDPRFQALVERYER